MGAKIDNIFGKFGKNEKLIKLLVDIINSEETLQSFSDDNIPVSDLQGKREQRMKRDICKFKKIYIAKDGGSEFRHSYAKLTKSICIDFFKEGKLGKLDTLAKYLQNLIDYEPKSIKESKKNEINELKKKLSKLKDHFELEFCRLELMQQAADAANRATEAANKATEAVTDATEVAENVKNEAKKATDAANRATNEAENFKKDLVAILGILAAILIGSVGSMIYGSKVFDHIEKATESQFLFGIGIVGLFFILMCCMLFSFLREITQRRDESGKIYVKLKRWVVNLGNAVVCVFFFTLCIFAFFGIKSCFFNENKNTPINKTTNNSTNITINANVTEKLKRRYLKTNNVKQAKHSACRCFFKSEPRFT